MSPTKHESSGRSGPLLYPRSNHRGSRRQGKGHLYFPVHRTLHHSPGSSCNARLVDGHDRSADVWHQHHRFLLVNRVRQCRCGEAGGSPRFLGVWSREFCLCLACGVDHRHLWTPNAASLHLPQHGMDPTRRRLLLLDPRRESCSPWHDRLLRLPLRRLLLSRRRPRPVHILGRGIPAIPP